MPGVRGTDGFVPLVDGWLQGAAYVTAALVAIALCLGPSPATRLWKWVAVALVLRAFGFVVFLGFVREMDPIPYPSLADAGWLATCFALIGGLVVCARERFARVSKRILLDG